MKFKKRDIIVYAVVVCLLLGIFIMSRPNGTNMDDEKVNSILLEDNNIDGIDYAEAFRSTALDIMQYEENDTGFNIAGSNADQEKADALVEIFNSIGLENVEKIPVLIDNVFNLVTKDKYWNKPTYSTLQGALEDMRNQIQVLQVKKLAMPCIGSGLDRLEWVKVRRMIKEIFNNVDIEIVVCIK